MRALRATARKISKTRHAIVEDAGHCVRDTGRHVHADCDAVWVRAARRLQRLPALSVANVGAVTREIDMDDSTWVLLQLLVAGWTGLFAWGVVRVAANLLDEAMRLRRIEAREPQIASDVRVRE